MQSFQSIYVQNTRQEYADRGVVLKQLRESTERKVPVQPIPINKYIKKLKQIFTQAAKMTSAQEAIVSNLLRAPKASIYMHNLLYSSFNYFAQKWQQICVVLEFC